MDCFVGKTKLLQLETREMRGNEVLIRRINMKNLTTLNFGVNNVVVSLRM